MFAPAFILLRGRLCSDAASPAPLFHHSLFVISSASVGFLSPDTCRLGYAHEEQRSRAQLTGSRPSRASVETLNGLPARSTDTCHIASHTDATLHTRSPLMFDAGRKRFLPPCQSE